MRLYVDDLRDPPGDDWVVARTSDQALDILREGTSVSEISLDHDLGGDDTTRPVVLYLCEHGSWPDVVRVHSANPVGVEWIEGMVRRYGPGITRGPALP